MTMMVQLEGLRLHGAGLSFYVDVYLNTFPLLPYCEKVANFHPPLHLWNYLDEFISYEGKDTSKITIHTYT